MNQEKTSIRSKIIITLSLVIIFIVAIVFFIIIPTINDIKTINDDIYFQREDLERKYVEGQLRRTIAENYERVKKYETKLKNVFVTSGQELSLITLLEQLAEENDLELTLSISDFVLSSGVTTVIPFSIRVTGEYANILSLLNEIESQEVYFHMNNIIITPQSRNNLLQPYPTTATFQGSLFMIQ